MKLWFNIYHNFLKGTISKFYEQHFASFSFWKFSHTWRLGPSRWIWGKWAQNGFWGIKNGQPLVRFTQKTLILEFHKNKIRLFIENLDPQVGWALIIEIWGKWAWNNFLGITLAIACQIFTNNPSFCLKF